jgi:hypothetical protein
VVAVVVALLVLGAASWAAWYFDSGDTAKLRSNTSPSCPAPSPTPGLVAAKDVRVNIFNATTKRGLAGRVATEMRKRGFTVGKVENDPAGRTVTGVAEIRSSTAGADAARTVAAQVYQFVAVHDQRKDASVDLVVGASFHALRPSPAAAAMLQSAPTPRPSGC